MRPHQRQTSGPSGGVTAVAASQHLVDSLSRAWTCPDRLVAMPGGSAAPADEFAQWIDGVAGFRAVIVENPQRPAIIGQSDRAAAGLLSLKMLAQRVRAAARHVAARRSGTIVCVLRDATLGCPPDMALCGAVSALVRSAASELAFYGGAVFGIVVAASGSGRDPGPAAGELAHLLSHAEAVPSGEVYLISNDELGRVAPAAALRPLVRSEQRLEVAGVAEALAVSLNLPGDVPATRDGERMAGQVAIVTGGAGGIGRAVATGLAAQGAAVVVADLGCSADGDGRDLGPARLVADEIRARGGLALAVCADVSSMAECGAVVGAAIREYGRVDVLCHAAGVVRPALIFEFDDADWDTVFGVHVTGAQNLIAICREHMRRGGNGRVVLFSSRSVEGSPGQAVYAAAKAAVLELGRSLAREAAGLDIGVNVVLPNGRTRASMPGQLTARRRRIELMRARHHQISDPVAYRESADQDPENNVPMITWLCGEAAALVTGHAFGTGGRRIDLYRPAIIEGPLPMPSGRVPK